MKLEATYLCEVYSSSKTETGRKYEPTSLTYEEQQNTPQLFCTIVSLKFNPVITVKPITYVC
jgi:hypothetical protein